MGIQLKKIKVSGNYLVVTNLETNIEEFTGRTDKTTYDIGSNNHISLYVNGKYKEGYSFDELLKDSDLPFTDLNDLKTFLRSSTGTV